MHVLLNVTLPVFGIILAGYVVGRLRLLGAHGSEVLNGFAFYVALPALLVVAMTRVPVADVLNGPFIAAYLGGTGLTYLIAVLVGRGLFPQPPVQRTMMGLTAVFANTGYMGVPLFLAAFGGDRALPAIIGMVLMATVTMSAGIVLVELAQARAQTRPRSRLGLLRDLARALNTNPLVMAPVLGLAVSASGLALPRPIETFLSLLGGAAGPCALFALGLFLVGKKLRANAGEVAWITVVKLIVQPAVTWLLAVPLLGLEPFWAGSVVLLSGLPTAALVFTLAQRYGVYVDRASSATLASTVLSVLTIPVILVLLNLR
ncbi:MAG: AEC family transporter [Pseudomonadota bacterium]